MTLDNKITSKNENKIVLAEEQKVMAKWLQIAYYVDEFFKKPQKAMESKNA